MADTIVMTTQARLDALTAKLTYLNGLTLRLFTNNFTPLITSVAGDFTEATTTTFPGYAAQAITDFGTPILNGSNNAESDTGVHTFTCTGTPTPSTSPVYGWYTTKAGGAIGFAARFAAPVPINITGANQSISITIPFEDGALA